MMPKLVKTHKYCLPVIENGKVNYGVWHKLPGMPKVAYCSRHASIQDCCNALKKRFPAESSAFTPNKLLLEKPNPVDKRVTRSGDTSERPIKRMDIIQYRGVAPETRYNGTVF